MQLLSSYKRYLPLAAVAAMLLAMSYAMTARRGPGRLDLSGQDSYAERAVLEAAYAARNRESRRPFMPVAPGADIHSDGGIMIVRNKDFEGVAEKPKSMEQVLREMAEAEKNPPVSMDEEALRKKIKPGRGPFEGAVRTSAVPLPGGAMQEGGPGMIAAPVDYKLFRNPSAWNAFRASHKGVFPEADFKRHYPLILVSMSDLPNCIFKIAGVEPALAAVKVYYRLDPLAMAEDEKRNDYEIYSSTLVPAGFDVTLVQVP